jgi:hypothetical protein
VISPNWLHPVQIKELRACTTPQPEETVVISVAKTK